MCINRAQISSYYTSTLFGFGNKYVWRWRYSSICVVVEGEREFHEQKQAGRRGGIYVRTYIYTGRLGGNERKRRRRN